MTNLEIKRNANITVEEIEDIRSSVNWIPKSHAKFLARYKRAMKHTYAHFTIRNKGKLIAFARVVSDGSAYAFIVDVNVRPEFQGKGIGRKLLKFIIKELKGDEIRVLQLTFKPELESFYKECGFEIMKAGSILNE
jgi:N-acetylglutamate synthase-like GNAT family acetyltransferase